MSVIHRTAQYLPRVNPAFADTLPDPFIPPDAQVEIDELEDTQPSLILPDAEDDFCDAPTIPGFKLRADGAVVRDRARDAGDASPARQWDRVLRAVAAAVKRVFATHSIKLTS